MLTCDDLATKAELQELRDQLNTVLGEKEDGTRADAFVKGQSPALSAGALIGTVYVATKERAANAVMDIVLDNPVNDPIWRDLANGNAKWSSVKGSGSRGPLPDLSKISKAAGTGASISTVGAKTNAANGAGIGILANLATIGTTLALNKVTTDVFNQRIDAEAKGAQMQIDAVGNGMIKLYQKNQGDISAVNGEIVQLQSVLQNQNGTISTLQLDVLNNRLELQDAVSDIDKAATRIRILETVSAESKQEIQELEATIVANNAQAQAAIDSLNLSVIELDNLLEIAKETIAKQDLIISKLDERVSYLETTIEDLAVLYGKTDADLALLQFEFDKLQQDLEEDDVTNDSQGKFKQQFDDLLDKINPDPMNSEQLEDFKTDVKSDFKKELGLAIGTLVIPNLVDLKQRTSPEAISQGVQAGICQSLNGGSCPATPAVPNPIQGLKGMTNNVNTGLNAAALAQGAKILGYVKDTNKAVRDKKYGLEAVEKFASTAWKATKADKIMNGINTMLLIHNAMMLSNNIGQTIGYALSQGLSVIGIKDNSTGEALDIHGLVGGKIRSVLRTALGGTNYAALTAKLRAANRIYQTGANVLSNVRSIIDSTQSIAETTGENVAVIGNALRQAGAVRENAYSHMPENLNNTSRVLNRLEKISDAASALEDISSEAVDIKDEIKEMRDSQKEFDEAKTKLVAELKKEDETAKSQVVKSPEQSEEDEERAMVKE